MDKVVHRIDYRMLPKGFWDTVIYYEYFISFSGFNEIEPHVTMWTADGKQYYINKHELRDGRYERVIPFFDCMAQKDKIEKGDFFYLNWEMCPEGWNYYYQQNNHCFIQSAVYQEFSKYKEKIKSANYKPVNSENESYEKMYSRLFMWKALLIKAYEDELKVNIHQDEITYIRLDEKIHVYDEPYVGRKLDVYQLSSDLLLEIKNAVAWCIDYTTPMESMRNLINVWIYFDKDSPLYISYNFDKDWADAVDEKDFMERFMNMIGCGFDVVRNGYSIDKAPDGYKFYQRSKYTKIYWIREDVYEKNYENVIEEFNSYPGNGRFLETPICACLENRKGYICD